MSTKPFQFSEAARLYVKNLDVMREMREAKFLSISEFKDKLLLRLPIELGKEHLCQKKTVTQGAYAGCDIYYLWIGQDGKKEWERRVGMISFIFPIPGKVISEEQAQSQFGVFEIVASHRMKVWVYCEGSTADVQKRTMDLALDEKLGELIAKEPTNFTLWINLEPEDPVASAARRLATLLRAVRAAKD